ncbi:MAG: hypothetical protein JW841_04570 [Deltaproteobacteria bacterium]|nr:hypothetical protein [Deltaproteobacteria bacterium]
MTTFNPISYSSDNTWMILQNANDQYQIMTDEDGPGGTPGITSGVLTEAELNAILMQMNGGQGVGFTLVDGVQVPTDGYTGPSAINLNSLIYESLGHEVPDINGPIALDDDVKEVLNQIATNVSLQDAALMFAAFMIMAKAATRDISDAREGRIAAQEHKQAMQQNQIQATKDKIAHLLEEARDNLATAWIIAAVSFIGGCAGAGIGQAAGAIENTVLKTITSISAAGVQACSTQLGNIAGAYRNVANLEEKGAKGKANKKEIEEKYFEMMVSIQDEAIEDKKSTEDAAREVLKSGLKIINDHYDQQTQIASKIFQE